MNSMSSRNRLVPVSLFVAALYLIVAISTYVGLTSRVLGGNDFYSRWVGARALFLRGENPYADVVTQEIQIGMYGRLALPTEDQVAFAYPLYVAFPIAPFVALPYPLAQAFWMTLLVFAVVGSVIILMRLNRLSPALLLLVIGLISTLVFYPSARGIFNGQVTLLSFFLICAGLGAISVKADVAAGVLFAFATIKPQPTILMVPVVLIWAWRQRRSKIVVGTLVTLGFVIGVALLLVPTWPLNFLEGIQRYAQYEPVGPPVQLLGDLIFPGNESLVFTAAFSIVLLVWLVLQVTRSLGESWDGFQATIGLTAIISTLMAGRMGTPDQVLLLIPWAQWLCSWVRRREGRWAALAVLAMLVLPWTVFLTTLRGDAEAVSVALVLPLLSLGVYLWQSRTIERLIPEQAR